MKFYICLSLPDIPDAQSINIILDWFNNKIINSPTVSSLKQNKNYENKT
jgi:hypothetical protein